jgi:hypothetical protein
MQDGFPPINLFFAYIMAVDGLSLTNLDDEIFFSKTPLFIPVKVGYFSHFLCNRLHMGNYIK